MQFLRVPEKASKSQWRIHFTQEAEGDNHCSPCGKAPAELSEFYRKHRDEFLEKKRASQSERLDSVMSSPQQSSQDSAKRSRQDTVDRTQPSIHRAMVSSCEYLCKRTDLELNVQPMQDHLVFRAFSCLRFGSVFHGDSTM